MEKKKLLTKLIIAIVLVAGCIVVWKLLISQNPFKGLNVSDIKEITVELLPPGIKLAVNDNEISEIVQTLNTVVIYQKDNLYNQYSGQVVIYTIVQTDGTIVTITTNSQFNMIDGVSYKTKYKSCEKLNRIANNLDSGKEGS